MRRPRNEAVIVHEAVVTSRAASTLAFQLLTIGKEGWGCQVEVCINVSVSDSESLIG
jgi:hypothetical protein